MFKIKTKKNQRGISLFLITVMIAILVGFSLNVAAIIVGSAKITSNVANSVKAFHCADSGVEYALYQISQSLTTCTPSPGTSFSGNVNDTNYVYSGAIINPNSDCGTGTTVNSLGSYGGATRKIQINY